MPACLAGAVLVKCQVCSFADGTVSTLKPIPPCHVTACRLRVISSQLEACSISLLLCSSSSSSSMHPSPSAQIMQELQ